MLIYRSLPDDLTWGTIKQIRDLVKLRSPNLNESVILKRICNAEHIAFQKDDKNNLISVCMIKVPEKSYVRKIAENAAYPELLKYSMEFGYAATAEGHEGKRYFQTLAETLLMPYSDTKLFATAREGASQHVIQKLGFRKVGRSYWDGVSLFVKN